MTPHSTPSRLSAVNRQAQRRVVVSRRAVQDHDWPAPVRTSPHPAGQTAPAAWRPARCARSAGAAAAPPPSGAPAGRQHGTLLAVSLNDAHGAAAAQHWLSHQGSAANEQLGVDSGSSFQVSLLMLHLGQGFELLGRQLHGFKHARPDRLVRRRPARGVLVGRIPAVQQCGYQRTGNWLAAA
jgi:hypothetical protein